jgi:ATP-binding cassette subfamily C protein
MRLSTIKRADRIYVLVGGKLVQQGSYEELIDVEGTFRELVRRQQLIECSAP